MASAVLNHWTIPHRILAFLPTEKYTKFVSKFFKRLCVFPDIKHLTTTSNHPQKNEQLQRSNGNIPARMGHYVAKLQRDWDLYFQPLMYASNSTVSRTTDTPFFTVAVVYRHLAERHLFHQ